MRSLKQFVNCVNGTDTVLADSQKTEHKSSESVIHEVSGKTNPGGTQLKFSLVSRLLLEFILGIVSVVGVKTSGRFA